MTCAAVSATLERLERLTVSTDQKTAARVVVRTSKNYPDPNAFGISAGPDGSCGESVTPFCKSCYAESLETQWPAVKAKVDRNYRLLRALGDSHYALLNALDAMLAGWYVDTVKRGNALTFRIHWDGDFYSEAYARAWADIVRAYPDVSFWVYTRAIFAARILAGIPNLAVYASVDKYNLDAWRETLEEHPTLRVAACADTFAESQALVLELGRRRAPKCPEGTRLPLVVGASGRGSDVPVAGEIGQGACNACKLCIHARADIRFATNKKG